MGKANESLRYELRLDGREIHLVPPPKHKGLYSDDRDTIWKATGLSVRL